MVESKSHNYSNMHRHAIRMIGNDYSWPSAYFVTSVTYQRACTFGDVVDGVIRLNKFSQIVAQSWEWLSKQYSYIELDPYIVMPNHFHGILWITELDIDTRGGSRSGCREHRTGPPLLDQLIGACKTVSAKKINILRHTSGTPI